MPHVYGDDARGRDVRRSATRRPRTACSSWTSCATSAAPSCRVRRRRAATARSTTSSGRTRPTPRRTCSSQIDELPEALRRARAQRRQPTPTTTWPASTPTSPRPSSTRPRCRPSTRRSASRRARTPGRPTDVIATASLVGGIFGKGGGDELEQVAAAAGDMQALRRQARACRLWRDLRSGGRPRGARSPCTAQAASPTTSIPPAAPRGSVALPDPGSLEPLGRRVGGPSPAAARVAAAGGLLAGLLRFPQATSNALLVSAAQSQSGHPLAVFGPQAGYFEPEILMEQDVHAPRHRRARRGVPRRQPLRRARPRPRLRVERHLGRPGHHRHVRGDLCDPTAQPTHRRTTSTAASACRWRPLERTNAGAEPADQTPPGPRRCGA